MSRSALDPAPPMLENLSWRAITANDIDVLVELAEACRRADGGLAFLNRADNLKGRYFGNGPGAAMGAYAGDGQLAACAAVHLAGKGETARATIAGQVRPEWRHRGIGRYLLRWSEAQAERLLTAAGVGNAALDIRTESLTGEADSLYRAHGFDLAMEELVMARDLRQPLPAYPLPAGVTLATWVPELAGQFFEAYQASFRDRPGFPGYSAEEWIGDRSEDENAKPAWSLLAQAGGAPVGFLTAGTEHPGGFVVQVGVIPEWRRRGLCSGLIGETMRRMRAGGEVEVQLVVNTNNPGAIKAYERLGFVEVGRRARYVRSG